MPFEILSAADNKRLHSDELQEGQVVTFGRVIASDSLEDDELVADGPIVKGIYDVWTSLRANMYGKKQPFHLKKNWGEGDGTLTVTKINES